MQTATNADQLLVDLGFSPSPLLPNNSILLEEPEEASLFTTEAVERDQAFKLARQNVNFLGILAAPSVFNYALPPLHLAIWQLLCEKIILPRDFTQLAIGLPRGAGKTMLIKLFIVYCILFTTKKFILILAATASNSENILSDVFKMLSEPNIRQIFGDWTIGCTQDTQSQKKFGFRGRDIIIKAVGAGGDVRGINVELERPDIMIFDDIQKREEAHNISIVRELEVWMIGTAMKAKSPTGCLFIYIGNMYPQEHTILKKLRKNPEWISFITGGILADGTALWEELQPLKQLLHELNNDISMGHPEVFFAEVMNDDTVGINTNFNIASVPFNPYEQDLVPQGQFIIIDPATDKPKADLITIGHFQVFDGRIVCDKLIEGRFSPGEMIRQALTLGLERGTRLICVEGNGYQYSAIYWFNFISQQYQITGFNCMEVMRTGVSKNASIKEMFKSLFPAPDKPNSRPDLYLHSTVRSQVAAQAIQWNIMKKDNTDGILDVLAHAPKCLELYGYLMPIDGISISTLTATRGVVEFNSPF